MKKIILTGGGTAGHVTPNLALLPSLKKAGYEIRYIGSYQGIERKLIEGAGIPYDGISSGKLRRYFDLKNFSDPFRVAKGYFEALRLMKRYKPDVVFSKGGFVAVPVVLAAKHYKVPVIIHESDMTPGLANKICIPSAAKVCCNFPETLQYLPADKAVLTGSPIRRELLQGDRLTGLNFTGLSAAKPIIMVIGGSLGDKVQNGTFDSKVIGYMNWTLVESNIMVEQLTKAGVKNVIQVPNFKPIPYMPQVEKRHNKLRFVFLSRIMPEKGCDYIIECANTLNKKGLTDKYEIDFYGEVAESYENVFNSKLTTLANVN